VDIKVIFKYGILAVACLIVLLWVFLSNSPILKQQTVKVEGLQTSEIKPITNSIASPLLLGRVSQVFNQPQLLL